jgi:cytochrome c553
MARSKSVLAALAVAMLAASASAQDLSRGEQLYALCEQCHGANGAGNADFLAPAIAGMPQWSVESQLLKFRAGYRGGHFDDIAGMRMRPMSLALENDDDVKSVAAFVASLPVVDPVDEVTGGDVARGQVLYAPCAACHAPDGSGNEAVLGPPLKNMSDWYLLKQLVNFRAGVRGTKPGDTSGALMRPMSMTLPDEQAMKDVIAYIQTLSK